VEEGKPENVEPMIETLFEAFNRRDVDAVLALCHPELEFVSVTAQFANRSQPYEGHEGMRRYFADVEETWDELQVTAREFHGDPEEGVLVIGRVVARSKQRGLRDMPAGWIWRLRDGLFAYGRVYEDPHEAAQVAGIKIDSA
jgi:ketosteroid isomerase-like protein